MIDRWFYEPTQALFKIIKFPFPLSFFFRRKIRNMLYAQGTGRHTQEEVYHILDTDLNALSIFLGMLCKCQICLFLVKRKARSVSVAEISFF